MSGSNMGFDQLYIKNLATRIDNSEYGKRQIAQLNKEVTKIKKMYNDKLAITKKAEL